MTFKRIVAAIDRTPLEQEIFTQAADIAATQKADLLLVHYFSTPIDTMTTPPVGTAAGAGVGLHPTAGVNLYPVAAENLDLHHDAVNRARQETQAWLDRYRHEATNAGIAIQTECIADMGSTGRQICETAAHWNADLIVLGRKGRTGLAEAFLGSTSNHVVHHAPCAVMVIQHD
jgi:nucleotide-binding universal stress UspA family protein